jgi:TolB-like protein/Tfp pilus assembly protein PilF
LSESQWVDMGIDGTEVAFAKLATAVRHHLTPQPIVDPAHADASATVKNLLTRPVMDKPGGQRVSRPVIALGTLIAFVVVYLAADKLWFSKRDAAEKPVTAMVPPAPSFNPPPHSVAVLPFVNMSGDPNQEYFSDGISEELLNALSRLDQLQVAARTSSFSFKGQNLDVSTIAHKLNVGAVLEGSVRRAGNTVRITVQLINAVSGFHMWSQTYDRNLTDILNVQAEVATSVAQQLKIKLAGSENSLLEMGGTTNSTAYEAYLRGSELLSNWDVGDTDLLAALAALDQAIALDPNFALAHAKRATVLTDISIFVAKLDEIASVRAQALQAAERAVAIAPDLGEVHLALAGVLSIGLLDFGSAAPEFDRALALSPGNARVQRNFAGFAGQLRHFQPAKVAARRAVSLDPQNVASYVTLGDVLTWARDYDDALTALHAASLLRPKSIFVKFKIANALVASGQYEQAREICESDSMPPQHGGRQLCLAWAYHGLGRQRDAENELRQLKALHHSDADVEIAGVYAQWGDKAAALQALAKAEQQRDPALQILRVAWSLDPIRNEPEFKAIEARMNFPP